METVIQQGDLFDNFLDEEFGAIDQFFDQAFSSVTEQYEVQRNTVLGIAETQKNKLNSAQRQIAQHFSELVQSRGKLKHLDREKEQLHHLVKELRELLAKKDQLITQKEEKIASMECQRGDEAEEILRKMFSELIDQYYNQQQQLQSQQGISNQQDGPDTSNNSSTSYSATQNTTNNAYGNFTKITIVEKVLNSFGIDVTRNESILNQLGYFGGNSSSHQYSQQNANQYVLAQQNRVNDRRYEAISNGYNTNYTHVQDRSDQAIGYGNGPIIESLESDEPDRRDYGIGDDYMVSENIGDAPDGERSEGIIREYSETGVDAETVNSYSDAVVGTKTPKKLLPGWDDAKVDHTTPNIHTVPNQFLTEDSLLVKVNNQEQFNSGNVTHVDDLEGWSEEKERLLRTTNKITIKSGYSSMDEDSDLESLPDFSPPKSAPSKIQSERKGRQRQSTFLHRLEQRLEERLRQLENFEEDFFLNIPRPKTAEKQVLFYERKYLFLKKMYREQMEELVKYELHNKDYRMKIANLKEDTVMLKKQMIKMNKEKQDMEAKYEAKVQALEGRIEKLKVAKNK